MGEVFAGDILVAKGYDDEAGLPGNGHVLYNGEELSMQNWLRGVAGWKSVETYKFAIYKRTGKSLPQIRKKRLIQYKFDNDV